MIKPIKTPVLMIAASAVLIILACLIPLINDHRWDNLIHSAALCVGVLVGLLLFTTAIKRAKVRS